jgi:hypothetical protein
MSCHTNNCHPSGLPQPNNECCTDVAEYTRFAYSSAQSAFANAENAQQSAEDAADILTQSVLKAGDTMTGLLILSGDPVVALGAATRQYVDAADALKVNRSGDTMTGSLNVPAGATGTEVPRVQEVVLKSGDNMTGSLNVNGNILSSSPASLVGYNTGAGNSVVQTTSRTTPVTINAPCGQITLFSTTTTAGTFASFTVNNSIVDDADVVIVNFGASATADSYGLSVSNVGVGSFTIQIHNIATVGDAEAPTINFAVIKAVTS